MKINRKKMENRKWAVRRYEELLDENKTIYRKKEFAHHDFVGYEKSEYLIFLLEKEEQRNRRKLRQVRLIFKKIGVEFCQ